MKLRIAFVSAPLPGHMDWGGMHRTAAALRQRGHEVVWVSEPRAKPFVDRLGLPFAPVTATGWLWPPPPMPPGLSPEERARERERRGVAVWLSPERVVPAVHALVDFFSRWKPDVIVTEPFLAAAAFAAELVERPLVVAGWPAVRFSEEVPVHQRHAAALARQWFDEIRKAVGAQGVYWIKGPRPWVRSPHLHLAYFTPEWYRPWQVLSPPTAFVGGKPLAPAGPPPSWLSQLGKASRVVFVTLGSTFVEDARFFARAARAAQAQGVRVVVAAGTPEMAAQLRPQLPEAAIVEPWVDYAHLFPRIDVAVHHGGVGTTHAALVYGVPQLVVPHAGDQLYQASRVVRAGVGIALRPAEATEPVLRDALQSLVEDSHWRLRARQFAEAMHRLGGVSRAAALVEEVAASVARSVRSSG